MMYVIIDVSETYPEMIRLDYCVAAYRPSLKMAMGSVAKTASHGAMLLVSMYT